MPLTVEFPAEAGPLHHRPDKFGRRAIPHLARCRRFFELLAKPEPQEVQPAPGDAQGLTPWERRASPTLAVGRSLKPGSIMDPKEKGKAPTSPSLLDSSDDDSWHGVKRGCTAIHDSEEDVPDSSRSGTALRSAGVDSTDMPPRKWCCDHRVLFLLFTFVGLGLLPNSSYFFFLLKRGSTLPMMTRANLEAGSSGSGAATTRASGVPLPPPHGESASDAMSQGAVTGGGPNVGGAAAGGALDGGSRSESEVPAGRGLVSQASEPLPLAIGLSVSDPRRGRSLSPEPVAQEARFTEVLVVVVWYVEAPRLSGQGSQRPGCEERPPCGRAGGP